MLAHISRNEIKSIDSSWKNVHVLLLADGVENHLICYSCHKTLSTPIRKNCLFPLALSVSLCLKTNRYTRSFDQTYLYTYIYVTYKYILLVRLLYNNQLMLTCKSEKPTNTGSFHETIKMRKKRAKKKKHSHTTKTHVRVSI